LIGAVLRPTSTPRQAFMVAAEGSELCVSQATLDELQEVLNRPKLDRYAPLRIRLDFLALVTQRSSLWEVDEASEQAAVVTDGKALLAAYGAQDVQMWTRTVPWTDMPVGAWMFYLFDEGERFTMILPSEY